MRSFHAATGVLFCMLTTIPVSLSAQPVIAPVPTYHETYGVANWRDLIPERRTEFQTYRTITLTNATLSDEEKARRVSAKFTEIRYQLQVLRTSAYEAVAKDVSKGNSCTKGSSGGSSKKCPAKCAAPELPNMYTTPAWARGAYKSGSEDAGPIVIARGRPVNPAEIVTGDGAQICAIRLKQSGRGRKVSYSEAQFRIRPGHISTMVNAELGPLMEEISKSPL